MEPVVPWSLPGGGRPGSLTNLDGITDRIHRSHGGWIHVGAKGNVFLIVNVGDILHMYFVGPWLPNTFSHELLRLKARTGLLWHIENTTSLVVQTSKNLAIRRGRQ